MPRVRAGEIRRGQPRRRELLDQRRLQPLETRRGRSPRRGRPAPPGCSRRAAATSRRRCARARRRCRSSRRPPRAAAPRTSLDHREFARLVAGEAQLRRVDAPAAARRASRPRLLVACARGCRAAAPRHRARRRSRNSRRRRRCGPIISPASGAPISAIFALISEWPVLHISGLPPASRDLVEQHLARLDVGDDRRPRMLAQHVARQHHHQLVAQQDCAAVVDDADAVARRRRRRCRDRAFVRAHRRDAAARRFSGTVGSGWCAGKRAVDRRR